QAKKRDVGFPCPPAWQTRCRQPLNGRPAPGRRAHRARLLCGRDAPDGPLAQKTFFISTLYSWTYSLPFAAVHRSTREKGKGKEVFAGLDLILLSRFLVGVDRPPSLFRFSPLLDKCCATRFRYFKRKRFGLKGPTRMSGDSPIHP